MSWSFNKVCNICADSQLFLLIHNICAHTGNLDGTLFTTVSSQRHKRTDNSWIMYEYNRTYAGHTKPAVAFGQVVRIFAHTLRGKEEIVIECDWYEECGVNPLSKLRQIRRNLHWEVCRCVFLNKCYPENLVAWSSNPRDPACAELDVVFH
jgi:hypothetical protein